MAKCPICDAEAKPRAENSSFPFCGTRCKTIDLGKWMNEEYRVPVEEDSDSIEDGEDGGGPTPEKTSPGYPDPVRH